MNEDYLWDKSGEPDPEIQQLEQILGTLRYQPKPLRLPRRRNYVPLLAIAATVLIAVLAGGLWLQRSNREPSISPVAIVSAPNPKTNRFDALPTKPPKKRYVVRKRQNDEALAAKQQLMFALRLASEKLNLAYRRTQDKRSSHENTLPN